MTQAETRFLYDPEKMAFLCEGNWVISALTGLVETLKSAPLPEDKKLDIDAQHLKHLDSAGALCLKDCIAFLEGQGKQVKLVNFTERQLALVHLIESKKDKLTLDPSSVKPESFLSKIGREAIYKLHQADGLVVLIGDLSLKIFESFMQWGRFQFPSIISVINSAGLQALPIIALLSFLIGVVLAYQMGLQLQNYGANIYIAYLSGLAIFREFSPLITAIIVAGRTSSSFTAQIGSMKVNEEIDALKTMGLSTTELLVMPKVLGLLIAMPLLIFWSDVFSIFGAMYMSKWMLGVGYYDFLIRLKSSVGLKQMLLGLYKTPVFAIVIAIVGCYQGFLVQSNASSIGSQTTKSVVQALFLIIIVDAIFSIIYSWMDL